jgi:hypothetical protein
MHGYSIYIVHHFAVNPDVADEIIRRVNGYTTNTTTTNKSDKPEPKEIRRQQQQVIPSLTYITQLFRNIS